MFSILETIAIIGIIIVQMIIAVHTYKKIVQMKSFLPKGRISLALKEYALPADKILELQPSQVVDKITYTPSRVEEVETVKEKSTVRAQPRDEKGRFTSIHTVNPFLDGDVEFMDEGSITSINLS